MNRNLFGVVLAAVCLASPGWGEGPPPPPQEEAAVDRPPRDLPPPPPIEQWMEGLKEREPEEYKRLQALKENDPQEFRHEIHRRLIRDRQGIAPGPMHGRGPNRAGESSMDEIRGLPDNADPAVVALREKAYQAAMSYRQAADDVAREQMKKELRGQLEELFDLKLKKREEALLRAGKELERLRVLVDHHRRNRDRIIDARLNEMTVGDPAAW